MVSFNRLSEIVCLYDLTETIILALIYIPIVRKRCKNPLKKLQVWLLIVAFKQVFDVT